MKKHILHLCVLSLALVFILFFSQKTSATFPSFEVFTGQRYPTVTNVSVYGQGTDFIFITAKATDVSGVSSVTARIRNPEGADMNVDGAMYDDGSHYDGAAGDNVYGMIINVSNPLVWICDAIYTIDISATDNLFNNSMDEGGDYANAGSFSVPLEQNCSSDLATGVKICIETSYYNADNCDEDNGVIICIAASLY